MKKKHTEQQLNNTLVEEQVSTMVSWYKEVFYTLMYDIYCVDSFKEQSEMERNQPNTSFIFDQYSDIRNEAIQQNIEEFLNQVLKRFQSISRTKHSVYIETLLARTAYIDEIYTEAQLDERFNFSRDGNPSCKFLFNRAERNMKSFIDEELRAWLKLSDGQKELPAPSQLKVAKTFLEKRQQHVVANPTESITKIKWLGKEVQIAYLFKQLIDHGLLQEDKLFKIIENHFVNNKGENFTNTNLARSSQNYKNSKTGKPLGSKKIDEIVRRIKEIE